MRLFNVLAFAWLAAALLLTGLNTAEAKLKPGLKAGIKSPMKTISASVLSKLISLALIIFGVIGLNLSASSH